MGTGKEVERTGDIELLAPRELVKTCADIRKSLNQIEDALAKDFPEINKATTNNHRRVQEALKDYYLALSSEMGLYRIRKSEMDRNPTSPYVKLFPDFVRYLSQFGEVCIGSHIDSFQGTCRIGVFLKQRNNEPKLLGILGIRPRPEQREYSGYVPIRVSEREFHGCSVYHLSAPDLGTGNFAFVRLLAEKRADGSYERADWFKNKGIEFP